ncbi:MAG: alpha/beta hydrolase [Aeromicrobium sp.]
MNEQPIDPEVTALLGSSLAPRTPVAEITAEQMRRDMDDAVAAFTKDAAPIEVHRVVDDLVPGRGGDIPVRVYSPETPTAVIVYMHGGAWVAGGIHTHEFVTRRISRDTGAIVISVDYRMLPEHPYPAPFDDAYDAVVWASALRPELPFIVAGDSAGGTLAACCALLARDEDGPYIDGQVLVYPAIDADPERPSMVAFREGGHIVLDELNHYLAQYTAPEVAHGSPYALPGYATTLEGLPPAVVVIAGHDLLRSAEEDYARRLDDAGVPVTVQLDHELVHGWIDFAPRVASADRAFGRLTEAVNGLIRRAGASS